MFQQIIWTKCRDLVQPTDTFPGVRFEAATWKLLQPEILDQNQSWPLVSVIQAVDDAELTASGRKLNWIDQIASLISVRCFGQGMKLRFHGRHVHQPLKIFFLQQKLLGFVLKISRPDRVVFFGGCYDWDWFEYLGSLIQNANLLKSSC